MTIEGNLTIEMGLTLFIVNVSYGYLHVKVVEEVRSSGTSLFIYNPDKKKTVKVGRSSNKDLSFGFDLTMSGFHGQFLHYDDCWHF